MASSLFVDVLIGQWHDQACIYALCIHLPLSIMLSLLANPPPFQVIGRLSEPGFLCRKHTITTTTSQQPLHKIQQTYSLPVPEGHGSLDCSYVWTWSRANRERNYSILNAERGVFMAGERICEGGRVYCMTATGEVEKRLWTGTAVSG